MMASTGAVPFTIAILINDNATEACFARFVYLSGEIVPPRR
jgi:hypothetical protein